MYKYNSYKLAFLIVILLVLTGCGGKNDSDHTPTGVSTNQSDGEPQKTVSTADASLQEDIGKQLPTGDVPTAVPPPKSSYDSNGDGFLIWDEVQEGVRANFSQFEFPSNYQTTADDVLTIFTANPPVPLEETGWENGVEVTWPGQAQFCAWAFTWKEGGVSGDATTQQEAMQQMRKTSEILPGWVYIRDDLNTYLNKAELGDTADFEYWVIGQMCEPLKPLFESTPAP